MQVEHVLRELVHRVAARRRAAHPRLERPAGHVRKRHLDLRVVMFGCGERDAVRHRRLRESAKRQHEDGEDEQHSVGPKSHEKSLSQRTDG